MTEQKKEIVQLGVTDAAIVALTDKYKTLTEINSTADYDLVVSGQRDARTMRLQVEDKRKEVVSEAVTFQRNVNSEAKRITANIVVVEDRLRKLRQAEDNKKAEKKAEKERVERERVSLIRERIAGIRQMADFPLDTNAEDIQVIVAELEAYDLISEEHFGEFVDDAQVALDGTLARARDAFTKRKAFEEERDWLAAERAKLDEEKEEHENDKRVFSKERERLDTESIAPLGHYVNETIPDNTVTATSLQDSADWVDEVIVTGVGEEVIDAEFVEETLISLALRQRSYYDLYVFLDGHKDDIANSLNDYALLAGIFEDVFNHAPRSLQDLPV